MIRRRSAVVPTLPETGAVLKRVVLGESTNCPTPNAVTTVSNVDGCLRVLRCVADSHPLDGTKNLRGLGVLAARPRVKSSGAGVTSCLAAGIARLSYFQVGRCAVH